MQANLGSARLVEGILSAEEAVSQIGRARRLGFASAAPHYPPSYRNNARLVVDDVAQAEWLYQRLRPHLPPVLTDEEGARWDLCGLNSRFRYCRYEAGETFRIHRDGAHFESVNERSFLTAMIYLNDASEFLGGDTRFFEDRDASKEPIMHVAPVCGGAAVFSQRLWHDGAPVDAGEKYILRTDVMYRRREALANAGHRGYIWDLSAMEHGRIVSGGRDKTIRIWDGDACLHELHGHELSVTSVGSDGGRYLWSGGRHGELRWWKSVGGTWRPTRVTMAHDGVVLSLTDAHHDRFASGGADGKVRTWSRVGPLLSSERRHASWVWSVVFGPDGQLYSGSEDGTIAGPDRMAGVGAAVRSLLWTRDSLYAGDARGVVTRWRPDLRCLEEWRAHDGAITALVALPGGLLASASEDDSVRLWSLDSQAHLETWRHDDFVRGLALGSDGRLWSGGYDGTLRELNWRRVVAPMQPRPETKDTTCRPAH